VKIGTLMIKAIIFDLGGTLIEYAGVYDTWPELEEPGLVAAYQVLLESGMALPDLTSFRQAAFELLPGRWRQATAGRQNLTVAGLLADVLDVTGTDQPNLPVMSAATARYEQAVCAGAMVIPNSQQTLAQLQNEGYRLGLISNTMFSGRSHMADLDRFELSQYFDSLLFSADVNKWKPTPAPFTQVMTELGVGPEVALFVGDDPDADVVGARAAGMRVVHFASSDRFPIPADYAPDGTIDALPQLFPILASLNGTS